MELEKEKLAILLRLQEVNSKITEETIKSASKEEILKYLDLIEKIEMELN